ncbi:3-phosphoshikimate 1-carboxyvinyltransferase [soil metagenome]
MSGLATRSQPGSSTLRPTERLAGVVKLPADKSIAHRALICAALADGVSTVRLREPGRDVLSTVGALRSLGVRCEITLDGELLTATIEGLGSAGEVGRLGDGEADCGNSGTTMRLLAGALASGSGRAVLAGDESLSRRPMERLAGPLRAMGALLTTTDGHAPLVIDGRRPLRPLEHELPIPSAQVLGAICLAALAADGHTSVLVRGPTRDHSERMLAALGAPITRQPLDGGATLTVIDGPAGLSAVDTSIPADFSSAAAWIVAASLHRDAVVRLAGVGLNPTRTALLDVLREMGAQIEVSAAADQGGEPIGDIVVRSAGRLQAVSVGPALVPALIDELPLLAVAMAGAEGTSEVCGASELRVKESDRIATMASALHAAGAKVEELSDGWRISRGRPRSAEVVTGGDHRVAMAMAVAGWTGIAAEVALDDPACVDVSYPSFWRHAASLSVAA